eukprot:3123243-Rhodomonas_salina.1
MPEPSSGAWLLCHASVVTGCVSRTVGVGHPDYGVEMNRDKSKVNFKVQVISSAHLLRALVLSLTLLFESCNRSTLRPLFVLLVLEIPMAYLDAPFARTADLPGPAHLRTGVRRSEAVGWA